LTFTLLSANGLAASTVEAVVERERDAVGRPTADDEVAFRFMAADCSSSTLTAVRAFRSAAVADVLADVLDPDATGFFSSFPFSPLTTGFLLAFLTSPRAARDGADVVALPDVAALAAVRFITGSFDAGRAEWDFMAVVEGMEGSWAIVGLVGPDRVDLSAAVVLV
jgi:hypothetical protein